MKQYFSLVAVLLLIVNFGCGNSQEKAAEKTVEKAIEETLGNEAGVDISEEGMSVTSTDEDGTYTWQGGDQAKIPESFPPDVHIYEGVEVLMCTETPASFMLALEVDAPLEAVVDSYLKEMAAAGWTKHSETTMDDGRMIAYGMGERSVNVGIFDEEGVTQISLSVSM